MPPGYPPPPQYPPIPFPTPCKCDLVNQIRYYNHKNRDFYYHTAVPGPSEGQESLGQHQQHQAGIQFYHDPWGPYHYGGVGPYPVYKESGICEVVLVVLALILWLYSFYRLYLVWQSTLNFQESSIQGPQGWDLLVSWIAERIRIKKLRMLPRRTVKRRSGGGGGRQVSIEMNPMEKEVAVLGEEGQVIVASDEVFEGGTHDEDVVPGDDGADLATTEDLSRVSGQKQLRKYLYSCYKPQGSEPSIPGTGDVVGGGVKEEVSALEEGQLTSIVVQQ